MGSSAHLYHTALIVDSVPIGVFLARRKDLQAHFGAVAKIVLLGKEASVVPVISIRTA